MINQNIKLYSWVDIQDRLLQASEGNEWLSGVKTEVFTIGLYVYYRADVSKEEINKWLNGLFPNAIQEEGLLLERLGTENRYLPIYFEEVEAEEIISHPFLPSFNRPKVLTDSSQDLPERLDNDEPVMIATHSFKGGVGRTLHAMAMASVLETQGKVLLIDGDFEAPGITWVIANPEISFVDTLNLIHGSENPYDVVDSIAQDLENQRKDNIYFLPAFRTERQMRSLEIKPEHIFRFSENPFIISDVIARLAQKLDVDYVIIDLRAGISELSASWLLDPRVANIFVTTLNSQSVVGTRIVLDILAQQQQNKTIIPKDTPGLIVSQVSPDQVDWLYDIWNNKSEGGSATSGKNMEQLREYFDKYLTQIKVAADAAIEDDDVTDDDVSILISPTYDSLLVLPNDWSEIQRLIKTSGLLEKVSSMVSYFQTIPLEANDSIDDYVESRRKMSEEVPNLVFAEKHLPDNFYKSKAIENLANKHVTRLPNLVIVGAKGAGKTFLFRQISKNKTWGNFLNQAKEGNGNALSNNTKIIKVTMPEAIKKTEDDAIWIKHIKPHLQESLRQEKSLNDWKNIWLDVIAWSYGFKVGQVDQADEFIKYLTSKKEQAIFLFDGLEDLFPNYYIKENQQIAIKALLQDVQAYIGVTPNAPLGIIAFIRKDIIGHVIKQNLGQFLDEHKEYELKWDKNEALRLVAWVMSHYGIFDISNLDENEISNATQEKLTKALYPLWGRKLGKKQSRQARSAKRILEQLSNFNEEVQSRDIIRFLAKAIEQENNRSSSYTDRILSPKSISNALPEVGKEKIAEVKQENRDTPFEKVLVKLENLEPKPKFPTQTIEGLEQDKINLLVDNGILKRHKDKYYMTELFRLGMGFGATRGTVKTDFN